MLRAFNCQDTLEWRYGEKRLIIKLGSPRHGYNSQEIAISDEKISSRKKNGKVISGN